MGCHWQSQTIILTFVPGSCCASIDSGFTLSPSPPLNLSRRLKAADVWAPPSDSLSLNGNCQFLLDSDCRINGSTGGFTGGAGRTQEGRGEERRCASRSVLEVSRWLQEGE